MSQPRKTQRNSNPTASAAAGQRLPRSAAVVLAVVIMAAVGFGWSKGCHTDAPQTADNETGQTAPMAIPRFGFDKLTGQWQRPDGGYIIEIRSVDPGGKMNAAYFNPRSINVAKAEASQVGETVNIFIELHDVNYPGSSYNLTYDPVDDCLKGSYFQAAIKQTFDVYFVRMKH
jgi:uncharacterized protein (DUF2147 family)